MPELYHGFCALSVAVSALRRRRLILCLGIAQATAPQHDPTGPTGPSQARDGDTTDDGPTLSTQQQQEGDLDQYVQVYTKMIAP